MKSLRTAWKCLICSTLLIPLAFTMAASSYGDVSEERAVKGFPEVSIRDVYLWSDGTRLAGNVLRPKDQKEGQDLPAIVLCHGWGGTKAHLNGGIAPRFAQAGFVVFTFDYRGWGKSNSRLVVMGDLPKPDADGFVTVKARAIQQLVDPLDQQEDIDAAITFIEGEPGVDANRIGIWGSSFGGGHVIWRAAHDGRVKCVVAQVGAMDQRGGLVAEPGLETLHANKIKRARGELAPVPIDDDKPAGLVGSPYYERFAAFSPVDNTDKITCPVLIIDAEQEHYFDIKENGGRVYEQLKGRVPVEYHIFEGAKHYDVYRGANLDRAMALEIPWFQKHLKGSK